MIVKSPIYLTTPIEPIGFITIVNKKNLLIA